MKDGVFVRTSGIIIRVDDIITKKSQKMCFVDIEDSDGVINAVLFPKEYIIYRNQLKLESSMVFNGKVQFRDDKNQLIISEVKTLDEAEFRYASCIAIRVDSSLDSSSAERLLAILKNNPGDNQVVIVLSPDPNEIIALNNNFRITVDNRLRQDIEKLPGIVAVDVIFV